MTRFQDEFARYSAIAFARQLAFAEFLGEHDWQADTQVGTVDFGEGRVYPIQLLGTEADGDNTWLWAWANEQSDLPDAVLQDCRAIRAAGAEKQLEELVEPSLSLDEVDGHTLALLSSGFIGDCAYYRGPHPGGAVFFLVKDLPRELLETIASRHALTTIMQLIMTFEVNHRELIESLFKEAGYKIFSDDQSVVGTSPDGGIIDVTFDEQGRIADMRGKQIPEVKKKKPWWKFW
jgi:hypothetical protein